MRTIVLNYIKLFAVGLMTIFMLVVTGIYQYSVTKAVSTDDEVAGTYKKNCMACHTAKAEKFFDPTKTESELRQTVLKGRKGEKPPFMPAFETKGVTDEQAKALVAYMLQLRTPAPNTNANLSNVNANANSAVNTCISPNSNAGNVNIGNAETANNANANTASNMGGNCSNVANTNTNSNANQVLELTPTPMAISAETVDSYKKSCAACHSAKAEKYFNITKTDAELETIILNGKKGDKPPYMPAFGTKNITSEQAKALVAYMRQLSSQSK